MLKAIFFSLILSGTAFSQRARDLTSQPSVKVNSIVIGGNTLAAFEQGTYTPVESSGLDTVSNFVINAGWFYTRIGDLVTISGKGFFDFRVGGNDRHILNFNLPIARTDGNFPNNELAYGVAAISKAISTGDYADSGSVISEVSTEKIRMQFQRSPSAPTASQLLFSVNFTYKLTN